ncbi:glycosyltransferase family 2 protein [Rhodococcus sp. BP-316]|uniref:glycosyltransferase family 2 protein n=1 Tax=unclassified Rhodococcus (in: high G+C Gram-positive bacteria) TaxID=192944 RepID=UPI001C9A81D3|nr:MULTISPECIES: glycosyltransferase family A protein [unclassified Rhodococcus (in: high G+C Gram-positive bacteria)]MBY6680854.1 glycosyltransferase family 2 protein [Rhodococcus sp. BP-316]
MSGSETSGSGERSRTTVVVATRNRADELATTLHHLTRLRPRPPVIVVDNASSDGTADVVRRAAEEGADVRSIPLSRNEGAAARNRGVWAAETEFVAFADDDSWWERAALTTAERIFDVHPDIALVAARTVVGPECRDDPVNAALHVSPLASGSADVDDPGPPVLGFLACAAIVRRRAFLAVGGFSPVLQFGGEETLLAFDLVAAGHRVVHVCDVIAHHHPSTRRMATIARRNLESRNAVLTALMRRPVGECVRSVTTLVARALVDPRVTPALVGAALRAPTALWHRQTLPPDVERAARALETTPAASGHPDEEVRA